MKICILTEDPADTMSYFGGPIYLFDLFQKLRERRVDAFLLSPKAFLNSDSFTQERLFRNSFQKVLTLTLGILKTRKLFNDFDIVHSILWGSIPSLSINSHIIKHLNKKRTTFLFDCRTSLFNVNSVYNLFKLITLKIFSPDFILFCDPISLRQYREVFSKRNVRYIPPPIDTDRFKKVDSKEKEGNERVKVLFATSLNRNKGLLDLLDAIEIVWRKRERVELLIAGDGPLRNKVIKLSKERKMIKYLGFVKNSQMPNIFNLSDILVQPSYFEGMSRTVLEALACQLPVIATNVGGHSILQEKGVAKTIPPNQPLILAREIIHFVDNEAERKSYGKRGREYVERNHSWNKLIKKLLSLYAGLI